MKFKSIGGFFELELKGGSEYHIEALRLNSGRNAFEYVLRAKKYSKVYLPYYTCDAMLEPIKRLRLKYSFYHINGIFEPIFNYSVIKKDEAFVYTNYFGLHDHVVETLSRKCNNLIIDNSQSFYSKPMPGIDTFYSPRKFFGLPDGAYLYTDKFLKEQLKQDYSYNRCEHLLRRIDKGPEDAYTVFIKDDQLLTGLPVMAMSNLTQKLLKSIDYLGIAKKRQNNFNFLHRNLEKKNKLNIELRKNQVPLIYPYYPGENNLRKLLIKNRIHVAQYWPNVLEWTKKNDIEYRFATKIIHLPIDQRYGYEELHVIIKLIEDVYE